MAANTQCVVELFKELIIISWPFQPSYRLAIRTEGMIEDLVKNLKSRDHDQARKPSDDDKKGDAKKGSDAKGGAKKDDKKEAPKATKPESVGKPNPELQMHCASAIFKVILWELPSQ